MYHNVPIGIPPWMQLIVVLRMPGTTGRELTSLQIHSTMPNTNTKKCRGNSKNHYAKLLENKNSNSQEAIDMHASNSEKLFRLLRNHGIMHTTNSHRQVGLWRSWVLQWEHTQWVSRFLCNTQTYRHIAWPGRLSFGRHHNIKSWRSHQFSACFQTKPQDLTIFCQNI